MRIVECRQELVYGVDQPRKGDERLNASNVYGSDIPRWVIALLDKVVASRSSARIVKTKSRMQIEQTQRYFLRNLERDVNLHKYRRHD
jgi:hypothetical protein